MIDEFSKHLATKIDRRIERYVADLSSGRMADHSEYKRVTGHIAGLNEAKEILKELQKQIESHDENDLEEM